jgi:hypothetical protein
MQHKNVDHSQVIFIDYACMLFFRPVITRPYTQHVAPSNSKKGILRAVRVCSIWIFKIIMANLATIWHSNQISSQSSLWKQGRAVLCQRRKKLSATSIRIQAVHTFFYFGIRRIKFYSLSLYIQGV